MAPLSTRCKAPACQNRVKQSATGRPKEYCSEACRHRARRQRKAAAAELLIPPAHVDIAAVVGLNGNSDEAVVKMVRLARETSAGFAYVARTARPELSFRCSTVADDIAESLRRNFKVGS